MVFVNIGDTQFGAILAMTIESLPDAISNGAE
jgi:hypothetical protein